MPPLRALAKAASCSTTPFAHFAAPKATFDHDIAFRLSLALLLSRSRSRAARAALAPQNLRKNGDWVRSRKFARLLAGVIRLQFVFFGFLV